MKSSQTVINPRSRLPDSVTSGDSVKLLDGDSRKPFLSGLWIKHLVGCHLTSFGGLGFTDPH